LIEREGRPLPRQHIFQSLIGEGINLQGKDPEMVLSTMLWRLKERFVRIPRQGYWLKEKDYPAGGYYHGVGDPVSPATDDSPAPGSLIEWADASQEDTKTG
jgi:hypothetical protein